MRRLKNCDTGLNSFQNMIEKHNNGKLDGKYCGQEEAQTMFRERERIEKCWKPFLEYLG